MFSDRTRNAIRPYLPKPVLLAWRGVLKLKQEVWRGVLKLKQDMALIRLKYLPHPNTTFPQRSSLVGKIMEADKGIVCPHTHEEMERIICAILAISSSVEGCVVEAGCFQGGSTAKLSVAAKLMKRKLIVFDSFAGLPDNEEEHDRTIFGDKIGFVKGAYTGKLDEVKGNVRRFGALDVCEFVQGWFEDTMPHFREPIAVAFIDVDLASSTKTCLRYLYPLLVPGGSLFSHDGHLPLCIDLIRNDTFWTEVVGCPRPTIPGLGHRKLLQIRKPLA